MIFYLFGRHIFAPQGIEPKDENFALAVFIVQVRFFGPFPEKIFELLDDEAAAMLRYVIDQCREEKQLFSTLGPENIDPVDKEFICYLMKPDPRDRPSAKEALMHPWLKEV